MGKDGSYGSYGRGWEPWELWELWEPCGREETKKLQELPAVFFTL